MAVGTVAEKAAHMWWVRNRAGNRGGTLFKGIPLHDPLLQSGPASYLHHAQRMPPNHESISAWTSDYMAVPRARNLSLIDLPMRRQTIQHLGEHFITDHHYCSSDLDCPPKAPGYRFDHHLVAQRTEDTSKAEPTARELKHWVCLEVDIATGVPSLSLLPSCH